MKKIKVLFALICFALMASMTPLTSHADIENLVIDVAPHVINLGSSSTWVTVHTNIPYGAVDCSTVTLNVLPLGGDTLGEVTIELCLEDDRGNFVAKFEMYNVRALFGTEDPIDGEFTFVLKGTTDTDPVAYFSDGQNIRVFNNIGKPGKM